MTDTNFSISAYQGNLAANFGEVRVRRVERVETQEIGGFEEITRTKEEFEDSPQGSSFRVLEVSTEKIPLDFNDKGETREDNPPGQFLDLLA